MVFFFTISKNIENLLIESGSTLKKFHCSFQDRNEQMRQGKTNDLEKWVQTYAIYIRLMWKKKQ